MKRQQKSGLRLVPLKVRQGLQGGRQFIRIIRQSVQIHTGNHLLIGVAVVVSVLNGALASTRTASQWRQSSGVMLSGSRRAAVKSTSAAGRSKTGRSCLIVSLPGAIPLRQ